MVGEGPEGLAPFQGWYTSKMERGATSQGAQPPLGGKKGNNTDPSPELPEGASPANVLTLAQ